MVRASLVRFHDGRRRVVDAGIPVTADDHGRYRIDGLAAGRYQVTAAPPPDGSVQPQNSTLAPRFPPQPAESKEIVLEAAHAVDLDLSTTPLPTGRISGRMLNSAGRPTTTTLLILPSHRSGGVAPAPIGGAIAPDGRFEFTNVPPGEYAVQAFRTRGNPSTEGEFAGAYVQVAGADVTGVELKATVGSTIRGRLTFADDEPIPQGRFTIVPARADLDQTLFGTELARGDVQNDQTFELHGLHGPRRLVLGVAPPGWILKAVRTNGMDVTDMPLAFGTEKESLDDVEIVATSRSSGLVGSVVDDRGARVANYSLLMFPVDRALWYAESRFFRRAEPGADGKVNVPAMSPGEYFAAAVRPFDAQDDSWQDPEVLEKLAMRATRATMAPGATLAITTTMMR